MYTLNLLQFYLSFFLSKAGGVGEGKAPSLGEASLIGNIPYVLSHTIAGRSNYCLQDSTGREPW